MKEQLEMIPVNDAFDAEDECPFCWLERKAEFQGLRYIAGNGASYMEPDVRGATDRAGFCRHHMKVLYDYGNHLGSALILQTHFAGILEEFRAEAENPVMPPPKNLFGSRKPFDKDTHWRRLRSRVESCCLCERLDYNMDRYFRTFFVMLKDAAFRTKVEKSKGFCLRHFSMLLEQAEEHLQNGQREWFYKTVYRVEERQLTRVKEDLDGFVAKFDYRNAGSDWKTSRDAVPRTMQKLQGLYPADPPFKKD